MLSQVMSRQVVWSQVITRKVKNQEEKRQNRKEIRSYSARSCKLRSSDPKSFQVTSKIRTETDKKKKIRSCRVRSSFSDHFRSGQKSGMKPMKSDHLKKSNNKKQQLLSNFNSKFFANLFQTPPFPECWSVKICYKFDCHKTTTHIPGAWKMVD